MDRKERDNLNALFKNPPKEFRGAPFWAWNGKAEKELLKEQINIFKEMGFGGYFIHSRIGLETEYLGNEFMDLVKECKEFGEKKDMFTWLYDEDKWPSGAGGGRVTSDQRLASRYLLFSTSRFPDGYFLNRGLQPTSRLSKNGWLTLLKTYEIILENGKLKDYRILQKETANGQTEKHVWYAYLVVTEKLPWFNNQPYVDVLNRKAIEKFIEVTHERYFQKVGEAFSKSIPGIFTDEPSFHRQENLTDGNSTEDVGITYTEGMDDFFQKNYGYDLLDHIPELIWERCDGKIAKVRYDYHDCVAEMFAESYSKTISEWCIEHKLALTGHAVEEEQLAGQSNAAGEVMRMLSYFTLPGIDMLADGHEYTTAKQAQSVARQYGRRGVTCELYGVTNWDFDFRGHKHQGDWLAALGVTLRVPHLSWMYMGGEAKRDYPSPIDGHTTWYKKYHLIEDYFARVNVALTRGKPKCQIAVLHPIESFWMLMGPDKDTAIKRQQMETRFSNIAEWLLFNLLDYDYISESILPDLFSKKESGGYTIGAMEYKVIVIPGLLTIRNSTLEILEEFIQGGGTVIFAGEIPCYVDGKSSPRAYELAEHCIKTGIDEQSLVNILEPYRDIDVLDAGFVRSKRLIYQIRNDGDDKWLFLAHGKKDDRVDKNNFISGTGKENYVVRIRGIYKIEKYNSMTGEISGYHTYYDEENTYAEIELYEQDSLLFHLTKGKDNYGQNVIKVRECGTVRDQYAPSIVDYKMEESNVLLLDQAEYKMDNGEWNAKEELLRIDDKIRKEWNYTLRTESFPQPWLARKNIVEHMLTLRFKIESQISLPDIDLAFECKSDVKLIWNGTSVPKENKRFYIDRDIHREKLGSLNIGMNELIMEIPFGSHINVEWCYLLGDFGVEILGDRAVIVEKPRKLAFGDLVHQKFPFYGGNVQYTFQIATKGEDIEIEIPEYYGALLTVRLDNEEKDVWAEPYRTEFTNIQDGLHTVTVTLYGTRINTFGQIHNANRKERYFSPKTWRTTGKQWTYLYQLRKTGITLCPILHYKKS